MAFPSRRTFCWAGAGPAGSLGRSQPAARFKLVASTSKSDRRAVAPSIAMVRRLGAVPVAARWVKQAAVAWDDKQQRPPIGTELNQAPAATWQNCGGRGTGYFGLRCEKRRHAWTLAGGAPLVLPGGPPACPRIAPGIPRASGFTPTRFTGTTTNSGFSLWSHNSGAGAKARWKRNGNAGSPVGR